MKARQPVPPNTMRARCIPFHWRKSAPAWCVVAAAATITTTTPHFQESMKINAEIGDIFFPSTKRKVSQDHGPGDGNKDAGRLVSKLYRHS